MRIVFKDVNGEKSVALCFLENYYLLMVNCGALISKGFYHALHLSKVKLFFLLLAQRLFLMSSHTFDGMCKFPLE